MATMDAVRNSFRNPGLQRRLLITLGLLIVFRVGAVIPAPGIDVTAMERVLSSGGALVGLYSLLTGGAFKTFSIFAMSIIPYINSSIIMQLLTIVIPRLEEWSKEGEEGRRKITQWTRYGSVILALVQAIGMTLGVVVRNGALLRPDQSWLYAPVIVLTLVAGSTFLMWLGELVTEKGIGNGISLIIFAGIVSRLPSAATAMIQQVKAGSLTALSVVLVVVLGLVVIAGVIYVLEGVRKIPVQYAKRVVGRRVYGGQQTFLPMKLNQAGVIPVIFAQSLVIFPQTIAGYLGGTGRVAIWIQNWLSPQGTQAWFYWVIYLALILGFTYFYTSITFNPKDVADNLRKQGGFIPGIRPGGPTVDYLMKLSNRITLIGAIFLGVITVFPVLAITMTGVQNAYLGGTSILIVVGVGLETMKQLQAQLIMRHYQGFIKG